MFQFFLFRLIKSKKWGVFFLLLLASLACVIVQTYLDPDLVKYLGVYDSSFRLITLLVSLVIILSSLIVIALSVLQGVLSKSNAGQITSKGSG